MAALPWIVCGVATVLICAAVPCVFWLTVLIIADLRRLMRLLALVGR